MTDSSKIRALAIHLPQFHPIPENDEWWGTGFTEWTNTKKAKPIFKDHYQPHIPSPEIGYYDLRMPEARKMQADLAKAYGIEGFCYYHYWFNGKLVLEKPIEAILKSGEPDFPFCLCWANENWSRNWDGKFSDVLLEQKYSHEDDLKHIQYLLPFFADKRYIKVDDKPVFIVYRTELFPDINRTAEIWRNESIKAGIGDLYLIRAESFTTGIDPVSIGFDAAFEFQPNWSNQPPKLKDTKFNSWLNKLKIKKSYLENNRIRSYREFAMHQIQNKKKVSYKLYPGITPMWDNTARRKENVYILHESTPEMYENWLSNIVKSYVPYSTQENFIFINAWNEWAEGNHLEPCEKWGRGYLEATLRGLNSSKK